MRNIVKKEINILLPFNQHALIARLAITGINMSSLSRLVIRQYKENSLPHRDDSQQKSQRVVIYLDSEDLQKLGEIAAKEGRSKSSTLRHLLAHYLTVHEKALNSLL